MVEPCPKCDTKVLDHGGRKKEDYYQVGYRCPKCGMKWTVLYGLRPLVGRESFSVKITKRPERLI